MSTSPAFSIVLPCYNEADNLSLLLEAYRAVWPSEYSAELVLVDNGSTDGTAAVLQREMVRPEYAFARTVLVPKNQGYGYGVNFGIRQARGEVIGISHADMQCPPRDLFRAYETLIATGNPAATFVKGKRGRRGFGASLITNTMAAIASVVLTAPLSDINAQPKVFHRTFLEEIPHPPRAPHRAQKRRTLGTPPSGFEFDLYLLYRARKKGLKVLTIPVEFGTRAHGTSKWAFSLLSRWRHIWATVRYIFRLRFSATG